MLLLLSFFLEPLFSHSSLSAFFCLSKEFFKKPYSFLAFCMIYGAFFDLLYTNQFGNHLLWSLWIGSVFFFIQTHFLRSFIPMLLFLFLSFLTNSFFENGLLVLLFSFFQNKIK